MNNLNLLKKLVSINSVFGNEGKISLFLSKYLENLGFKVELVLSDKDRPNIVATFGKARKYLGFYGHMDTVPPDEDYKHNPLKMVVKQNMAFGLGVGDMKGGMTAILQTAEFASKNNLPIKIVFGVDEESISKGAHDLVNSKLLGDLSFLIVGESGQVYNIKQPFSVVFGRKGRTLFDIEVFGKKAHAAESKKGINAIEQACKLIDEIKEIKFPADQNLGTSDVIFQEISSRVDSFSVPNHCLIRCSLLNNSLTKSTDFINYITKLTQSMDIKIKIKTHPRLTPYGESYCIDTNNRFLKEIIKSIIKPYKVEPIYTTSVADENIFANRLNIPVLTMGPICGNSHATNEWVSISSLQTLVGVYKKILKIFVSNSK